MPAPQPPRPRRPILHAPAYQLYCSPGQATALGAIRPAPLPCRLDACVPKTELAAGFPPFLNCETVLWHSSVRDIGPLARFDSRRSRKEGFSTSLLPSSLGTSVDVTDASFECERQRLRTVSHLRVSCCTSPCNRISRPDRADVSSEPIGSIEFDAMRFLGTNL